MCEWKLWRVYNVMYFVSVLCVMPLKLLPAWKPWVDCLSQRIQYHPRERGGEGERERDRERDREREREDQYELIKHKCLTTENETNTYVRILWWTCRATNNYWNSIPFHYYLNSVVWTYPNNWNDIWFLQLLTTEGADHVTGTNQLINTLHGNDIAPGDITST